MDQATFLAKVRAAGVVGEGGAGFPAHVKYNAKVATVIANGCECEPLLHSDQYLMANRAADIARGLQAVMAAVGASRGVVALKKKYEKPREALTAALAGSGVELALLGNFYPAGDEQVLVREVTGRSVPPLGLPKDVDALVANVGTLCSVSQALADRPVTHKLVTVTGEVARPGLWRTPVGTPVAELVALCGGAAVADPVYLLGGPMMGRILDDPAAMAGAVVTKTVGGVIVLPRGHYLHEMAGLSVHAMQRRAASACIQCRYCTERCPRYLIGHRFETHRVMRAFAMGDEDCQGARQALLCCECGACELMSCPMGLSPRRINAYLKVRFRERKLGYEGSREIDEAQAALSGDRKISTTRLANKLGLGDYLDLHPAFAGDHAPRKVLVPLRQHLGAPAAPLVKPGERVAAGQVIGEIPEGALGARVHAPISGTVSAVADAVTIEGA